MKINFICLFILVHLCAVACDSCGGFMGLTPYDNQSQFTLLHRYRVFNGYRTYQQQSHFFIPGAYRMQHAPGGDSAGMIRNHSSRDYEAFKMLELRLKYFLHPRWELNVFLPVQQIRTCYNDVKTTSTGLADPSLFVGYHVIKRLEPGELRQRLVLGGGIKFPVGDYRQQDAQQQRLDLLVQSGSGSWDHFYYLNYILSGERMGVNINSLFKLNGENEYNEHLGNSFSQVISVFARFSLGNVTLYPAALASYEHSRGLFVNDRLEPGTNTNLLLLGPSVDVGYKQFALNMGYQFNAYERVSSQSLSASGRFMIGLTFNLKQEKYLVKSK